MSNLDNSDIMQLATGGNASGLQSELRSRGLKSLYYFCKVILGYNKLVAHLHQPFCDHIQGSINTKKRGYLMPRGHFKSTIMKGYILWRLCGGGREQRPDVIDPRNLRILFVGESEGAISGKLKDIKKQITDNQLLRWLFPEIIPVNTSDGKWTETQIDLPRSQSFDEPTITAIGVGGASTGKHYDIIIYDDLIGEKAADSEAVMKDAVKWFQFAPGLINDQATGEELIAGTRWKHGTADVYGWIMENLPAEGTIKGFDEDEGVTQRTTGFHWYIRSAIEPNPVTGEEEPIFPERFTKEALDEILARQKDYKFSCNYMNQPSSPEGADFPESLLKWFNIGPDGEGKLTMLIPEDGSPVVRLANLLRITFHDPSSGGKSATAENAIITLGIDSNRRKFILDAWFKNCGYGAALEKWHLINDKYCCDYNYFEDVGSQKEIKELVQMRLIVKTCPFCKQVHRKLIPIGEKPPGGGTVNKEARIRSYFQNDYEMGLIYIRRGIDSRLRKQILGFPHIRPIDGLDAAAYGVHMLNKLGPPKTEEDIIAEQADLVAKREATSQRIAGASRNYGGYV